MDSEQVTLRALTRADVPAALRLLEACERDEGNGMHVTEDDLLAHLDGEVVSLEEDTVAMVLPDGELAAFGVVTPGHGYHDVARVNLFGAVHPERQRRGIGRTVVAWQVGRALRMHAETRPDLPALVATGGTEREDSRSRLLGNAGFSVVRRWYEMERDLSTPLPEEPEPAAGVEVAGYATVAPDAVRRAHNEAFAEHWGSGEIDGRAWSRRFDPARGFRPDLSLVSVDGDEVAAYLLAFVSDAENESRGVAAAQVTYVGSRPRWRGRRLGEWLLVRAMESFRDAGYAVARLTVDTQNGSGAVGLYERVGFTVTRRYVTYGLERGPIRE